MFGLSCESQTVKGRFGESVGRYVSFMASVGSATIWESGVSIKSGKTQVECSQVECENRRHDPGEERRPALTRRDIFMFSIC